MTGLILSAAIGMMPGAGSPMQGPGIGLLLNKSVQEELDLSDKQVEKIQKVFNDMQSSMIDLRAEMQHMRLEMRQLMAADQPDEKAISQLVQKINDKRAEMEMARIKAMLEVKKILSDEQFEKFQAMKPFGKASKHGKGKPGRGNPHF